MTSENWTEQRERSNRLFLVMIVWIARRLGRGAAHLVLRITAFYYLLTAPAPRAASRDYLWRVFGRAPGWRQIYRHFYCFAITILDRVYVMAEQDRRLHIEAYGREVLHRYRRENTGAIVITSHLGSFEMLRVLGRERGGLRLRVLMDRAAGAKANAVLDTINPALRESFIDTSASDVDRVLKVQAALEKGEIVSLMADRCWPGERAASCRFLDGTAPFPLAPWLLAGVLRVPVVIAFGLYRGGNCYELYFEEFAPRLELSRERRIEEAGAWAQAYADRLTSYTRYAPYNWFNFFDYWES